MYCQQCGHEIPDEAKFCHQCGYKLGPVVHTNSRKKYTIQTALKNYFQGTIGETKLREAIRKGKIPHTRIGSRIILREEALDNWMNEQERLSVERHPGKLRVVK
ncbi:MAG: zinc-ribbon domain-containing protein [Bacillota bacterium]